MFSRSGMHPAIDQVLGLVLVRAISSKDSTIRDSSSTEYMHMCINQWPEVALYIW